MNIGHLDNVEGIVYFSTNYSSFKAFYDVETFKDVSMNGEIETVFDNFDVTVSPNAYVIVDTDGTNSGEELLSIRLSPATCGKVARMIEKELKND